MSLHIQNFTTAIGNPAKTFLWNVIIPGAPMVSFKAQTTQFPAVGSADMELHYQGQPAKFAGAVEYEHTWSLVIAESEIGDVFDFLYSWRQLIWNQLTAQSESPVLYKRPVQVIGKTSMGGNWISAMMMGAYPKNIDAIDLDRSSNSDIWKWSVQFNFDWWFKT